jgi:hypothetical protein
MRCGSNLSKARSHQVDALCSALFHPFQTLMIQKRNTERVHASVPGRPVNRAGKLIYPNRGRPVFTDTQVTRIGRPSTEKGLHAFIDGVLEEERQGAVKELLRANPGAAGRIDHYTAQPQQPLVAFLAPTTVPISPQLDLMNLVESRLMTGRPVCVQEWARGGRLTFYVHPVVAKRPTPAAAIDIGAVDGCAWIAHDIGYSLKAAETYEKLVELDPICQTTVTIEALTTEVHACAMNSCTSGFSPCFFLPCHSPAF